MEKKQKEFGSFYAYLSTSKDRRGTESYFMCSIAISPRPTREIAGDTSQQQACIGLVDRDEVLAARKLCHGMAASSQICDTL